MARKVDIIAPQIEQGSSALTLARWLKNIGDPVLQNEPIAEVAGAQARGYVHSPAEGTMSALLVRPGQTILSGALMGHIAVISKKEIDWTNFDQVTEILEEFAGKSIDYASLKDANEALSQLLGVTNKDVFRKMSIEQQNKFLQNVVDQHAQGGMGAADIAQKLLEGLHLRNPKVSGPAVRGPALGMGAPTPGGMGGGYYPQQPPQYPQHQQQWPPQQLPHGYPPYDPNQAGIQPGHYPPPPHVPHGNPYPPQQQHWPAVTPPPLPPKDDDKS